LPTPPYTNPFGLLSELFPTIIPECRLIFFTGGPGSIERAGGAVGLLPDARAFGSKLGTDPIVATLLKGVVIALMPEGSPFPS